MDETYIPAPEVARRLGVKTGTLAKWRRLGNGPKGWIRRGRTVVIYPASAVAAYLAALTSVPGPTFERKASAA